MSLPTNRFADLPEELVQTLVSAAHVAVERIVSHGHASLDGCRDRSRTGDSPGRR